MKTLTWHGKRDRARHGPIKSIEDAARHLHEIEEEGESPATPAISILAVLLVVGPIFVLILGLSFLAYYVLS